MESENGLWNEKEIWKETVVVQSQCFSTLIVGVVHHLFQILKITKENQNKCEEKFVKKS